MRSHKALLHFLVAADPVSILLFKPDRLPSQYHYPISYYSHVYPYGVQQNIRNREFKVGRVSCMVVNGLQGFTDFFHANPVMFYFPGLLKIIKKIFLSI